ncbi:MAG: TetR/AcrR family transcriptional regulator [Candidatus Limnocylindrus sp.]
MATSQHHTSSKEMILALAITQIDRGGEASIRVKQIADDAGTSVTSIYHFYGSREGLIEAAQIARFEGGYAAPRSTFLAAAQSVETREDFTQFLEAQVREIFTATHRMNRRRRMNVAGSAIARPDLLSAINDVQRKWYAELVDGLRTAKERGLIGKDADVESIATWHLVTVNGFPAIEGDSTGTDVAKWLEFYIDTMFRALGLR